MKFSSPARVDYRQGPHKQWVYDLEQRFPEIFEGVVGNMVEDEICKNGSGAKKLQKRTFLAYFWLTNFR